MGLRLKFNLVLLLVFLVGLGVAGWISREILIRNAREEVSRNAGLMMETALAVRGYTITQVRPHLDMQLMRAFLPQSVPAFAAAETMGELRKKYPDYFYKEATLNPTNPRNRASDWEADIVQEFRNRPR
jgi:protein-histidine pros-kinase